MVSTARDMAKFGQMILNRGRYGEARILSQASVAAMTRDQIPGLQAQLGPMVSKWASWGYGFAIESPQKWPFYNGGLVPLGTLCHPGAGGAMFWIDPEHEIVGTYFEATKLISSFDHFINMVTAAADD
jgi:CubicO group peptidase (beta-lactamase class C family)